ncbi:MAG TPA: diguanylate cyclase [Fibrobacteria bacterium]|nr:diguanylate cyclase [Fibrobacteria bacterium]
MTASIGVAHGRIDDFDTLVKRADEALYRAKTSGRNRVETAI